MKSQHVPVYLNPFYLTTVLFAALAALMALDAWLANWGLFPVFSGLPWLRVHFITLGLLTEMAFGVLSTHAAERANRPSPQVRWDIWLALNSGLLTLLTGIPLVSGALIVTGGALVFIAAGLLLKQLVDLRPSQQSRTPFAGSGRSFYVVGLSFLLLGVTVGTGLWLGWSAALHIEVPLEVHIHANNWGFMAFTFAGLIVNLYPRFTGHALAWPRSLQPIFWMMTAGAIGLVLGPWLRSDLFTVPGIILHLSATVWLLLNMIKPVWHERRSWVPGIWHLLTAYVWLIVPVLVAPLILLKVPGFPGVGIEQTAPQALIYGWVLQFGFAILPYLITRAVRSGEPASLGGNWFSLVAIHAGCVFLWVGIFSPAVQSILSGIAYALWLAALAPLVASLWRIVQPAMAPHAPDTAA